MWVASLVRLMPIHDHVLTGRRVFLCFMMFGRFHRMHVDHQYAQLSELVERLNPGTIVLPSHLKVCKRQQSLQVCKCDSWAAICFPFKRLTAGFAWDSLLVLRQCGFLNAEQRGTLRRSDSSQSCLPGARPSS